MTPQIITPDELGQLAGRMDLASIVETRAWTFPVARHDAAVIASPFDRLSFSSIVLDVGQAGLDRRATGYRGRHVVFGLKLDGLLVVAPEAARMWRAA